MHTYVRRLVAAGAIVVGLGSSTAQAAPAAGGIPPAADAAPNVVTDWAAIVQQAIHNPGAPRSGGTSHILHTMVMLAVYDAVVAIEGGYQPYAVQIHAQPGADVRAAVATAAFLTARSRVAASQIPVLDQAYGNYLAAIPDGPAKSDGIDVGQKAAEAMIELRANDGFGNVVPYTCSATPPPPGEFEPTPAARRARARRSRPTRRWARSRRSRTAIPPTSGPTVRTR